MAWKNQNIAPAFRTCKHLREYLGEEYEKARVAVGGCQISDAKVGMSNKQKISVLLAKQWDGR